MFFKANFLLCVYFVGLHQGLSPCIVFPTYKDIHDKPFAHSTSWKTNTLPLYYMGVTFSELHKYKVAFLTGKLQESE